MAKYKDWRKFDPLTMRNEQIRNTPETARVGYSALDPAATVSGAYGAYGETPDWAKRTPTEQARVNAAQARAQEQSASTPAVGYAALDPNASPYNGGMPTYGNAPVSGYAALSDEYIRRATTEAPTSAPVSPYAQPASPYNYGAPKVETATAPAKTTPATTPATGTSFSFANLDDASKAKLKQNNPAFYNQLLVQGIISPMAEDQKQTATAPTTVQKTLTAPKTDAESTSTGETGATGTGETDPTGYAKYLADNPELAEADRRAEAEYARALPTYGALAERMAQAGIHGGYSDYLQGVAYAKMQDAKQQGYATLTGNGGTVMSDTAKELYKNLLSEYGDQIAGITDETHYAQFENLFRSANKGLYSDADIESALKQAREYRTTQKTIDTATVSQGITDYTTGDGGDNDLLRSLGYDPETFIDPQGEKESDEAYAERYGEAFIKAVNEAYKANRIDKPQHSAILTTAMPIFDEDFDTMDWKDKGASIAASIDLAINGDLTDEDYAKVVEKVKEHLKSVGVESIYYDHQGIGRSSNLDIKIRGGAKNYEDIHADQVGGDITAAEKKKLEQYGDLPLAYLVNSDGTTTLYYQNEHGWRQLKTKGGSTSGSPKLGNNWYMAIAFLMMNGNKPTETVTTSKNQTYKFITN